MPDAPRASHADVRPGVVWRGVARSGIALLMIGGCTCLNRYLLGTSPAEEPAARPLRAAGAAGWDRSETRRIRPTLHDVLQRTN